MTNTLLYAIIITAIIAIFKENTWLGALIFAIVTVLALGTDRNVEDKHLKEKEGMR